MKGIPCKYRPTTICQEPRCSECQIAVDEMPVCKHVSILLCDMNGDCDNCIVDIQLQARKERIRSGIMEAIYKLERASLPRGTEWAIDEAERVLNG